MSYGRGVAPSGGYNVGGGGSRWDSERFQRERDRMERTGGRFVVERDRVEHTPGRKFEERDFIEEDYIRPSGGSPYGGGAGRGGGGRGGDGDRESYRRGPDRPAPMPQRRERSADERFTSGRSQFDSGGRGTPFDVDGDYSGGRGLIREGRPGRSRPSPAYYHEEDHDITVKGPATMIPYRPAAGGGGYRSNMPMERRHEPPSMGGGRESVRPRPGMMRRQSSLDTFDRKPMTRYVDREIDISYRASSSPKSMPRTRRPPPARSPPRRYEREYKDIRIAEPDYYGDEDYRDYRERDIIISRGAPAAPFDQGFDGPPTEAQRPFPRRGKTKMPSRLVERSAITALGYPFDQEGDMIIILKALSGDQIDEVVRVSEEIRKSDSTFKQTDTRMIEFPISPTPEVYERRTEIIIPAPSVPAAAPGSLEIIERVTESRKEGTSSKSHHAQSEHGGARRRSKSHVSGDDSSHRHTRSRSHRKSKSKSHRSRSSSSSQSDTDDGKPDIVDGGEDSASIRGPLTVLQSDSKREAKSHKSGHGRSHKDERQIKSEIKALEREEKALKLERRAAKEERKAEKLRKGSGTMYLETERNDGVKLERSKKEVDSKLLKLAMATLT